MSEETGARQRRYVPRSRVQAVGPTALVDLFSEADELVNEGGDVATIVKVRGPLTRERSWWWDSYEALISRVNEACQQAAPVVVLDIDSPGGEVSGLFDTARAIRRACDDAGKRLVVHTAGQCASAAYAIAAMADKIVASTTAEVGSIGVIAARLDSTAADALAGHRVALIASGERKTDWHPSAALTDEELRVIEADIAALGAEFFDLVAGRRGMSPKAVQAMQAASYRGEAAVEAGLVDELGSFDDLLASLGGAGQTAGARAPAQQATRQSARAEKGSQMSKETRTVEEILDELAETHPRAAYRAMAAAAGRPLPKRVRAHRRVPTEAELVAQTRRIEENLSRMEREAGIAPEPRIVAATAKRQPGDVVATPDDSSALPFEQAARMREVMGTAGPSTFSASTTDRLYLGLTEDEAKLRVMREGAPQRPLPAAEQERRRQLAEAAIPPLSPARAAAMRSAMGLTPGPEPRVVESECRLVLGTMTEGEAATLQSDLAMADRASHMAVLARRGVGDEFDPYDEEV